MEFLLSIKTKIAAIAVVALAVSGSLPSTTRAEAHGPGWGIGADIVGAAIVGSAIAASNDGYYYGAIAAAAGFASSSLRQFHRPRPHLQLLLAIDS